MNFTFENEFESGSGEGWNISSTPPDISNNITPSAVICSCILLVPLCVISFNNNNPRISHGKCCGIRFCYRRTYMTDIERNNQYNTQINTENQKKSTHKIIIVDLVDVVVADPFDATETCSICLEELKEGDELGTLPCGHKHFHKKCVNSWMAISGNKSCPICRNVSV